MKDTPHGKRTLIESKEINDRKKMNTEQSENEGHEQNQTKNIKEMIRNYELSKGNRNNKMLSFLFRKQNLKSKI